MKSHKMLVLTLVLGGLIIVGGIFAVLMMINSAQDGNKNSDGLNSGLGETSVANSDSEEAVPEVQFLRKASASGLSCVKIEGNTTMPAAEHLKKHDECEKGSATDGETFVQLKYLEYDQDVLGLEGAGIDDLNDPNIKYDVLERRNKFAKYGWRNVVFEGTKNERSSYYLNVVDGPILIRTITMGSDESIAKQLIEDLGY